MDGQDNQPDKCFSGRKTGKGWEYAFFWSDPHFYWKDCPAWCSQGVGVFKNRIIQLFDLGMVNAKTPSENLASGRLLCSRSQKEPLYLAG